MDTAKRRGCSECAWEWSRSQKEYEVSEERFLPRSETSLTECGVDCSAELETIASGDDLWDEILRSPEPPRISYSSAVELGPTVDVVTPCGGSCTAPLGTLASPPLLPGSPAVSSPSCNDSPDPSARARRRKRSISVSMMLAPFVLGRTSSPRCSEGHPPVPSTPPPFAAAVEQTPPGSYQTSPCEGPLSSPTRRGPVAECQPSQQQAVRTGSLNRLIQKLTPENGVLDVDFAEVFLGTMTRFSSREQVLRKLVSRFLVPGDEPPPRRVFVKSAVLRAISMWFAQPMADKDFTAEESRMVSLLVRQARHEGFLDDVEALLTALATNRTKRAQRPVPPTLLNLDVKLPIKFHELNEDWLDTLHQQFCLVDHDLYCGVQWKELLCPGSTKGPMTPSLRAVTRRFNQVTLWAASLVAQPVLTAETRSQVVEMLLQLAQLLHQSNNFMSLRAVVTGLTKNCVRRWVHNALAKNSKKRLKLLEFTEFVESGRWVTQYRTCALPAVPFIPLTTTVDPPVSRGKYQTDLARTSETMPDKVEETQDVLFGKQQSMYRTVSELMRGRVVPYDFPRQPTLHFYAVTLPESLDEPALDVLACREQKTHSALPPNP